MKKELKELSNEEITNKKITKNDIIFSIIRLGLGSISLILGMALFLFASVLNIPFPEYVLGASLGVILGFTLVETEIILKHKRKMKKIEKGK